MPAAVEVDFRDRMIAAQAEAREEGLHQGRREGSRDPIPLTPPENAPTVLIGTHHKTGTVWMLHLFKRVAALTGRRFIDISPKVVAPAERDRILQEELARRGGAILFEYESRFPVGLSSDQSRGLHVVRDPRDIVVSATTYHTWADEPWLHEPDEEFAGKSYRDTINQLESIEARQLFELAHKSGETIERMLGFDAGESFLTWRYEDLIIDTEMRLWHDIGLHLGFGGRELPLFLRAVWEKSLFGDLKPQSRQKSHIQSGGRTRRWKTDLTQGASDALEERFGAAWRRWGYE